MSDKCRKCGGPLRTQQVNNVLAKFCNHCGSLPFATNVKTGESVRVDRAGKPIFEASSGAITFADMEITEKESA